MSENLAGTGPRMVLVAVGDETDRAYGATFAAGSRMARESGAELCCTNRSAESYLVDPYPYHDGLDDTVTIDAAGARALGREYLAAKFAGAAADAVSAAAWLPRATGAREMARCVQMFPVHVVVLPASLASPSLLDRARGNTLQRFRETLEVPIVLVTFDGELVPEREPWTAAGT